MTTLQAQPPTTTPTDPPPTRCDELGETAKRALAATNLPAHYYWSEDIYRLEIDKVFLGHWICVGRIDEIPAVGDFFTRDLGPESVLIVRDGAKTVRAHLNVCRHRSCQLVAGKGTATSFKCPYHGWLYTLSGELRGAAEMQDSTGFDKKDYPLIQAKVELWHGFIFINFAAAPAPLHQRIGGIEEWVAGYDMSDQVTTREWQYQLDCNWKAYIENFVDEYHLPWVHGKTLEPIMPMKGWHSFPELKESWELIWGEYPNLSWSNTGEPLLPLIKGLTARNLAGMPLFLIYPTFMCMPAVDCTFYYLIYPTGPETSVLLLRMCVPKETAAALQTDTDLQNKAAEYYRNVELFIAEDNEIAAKQQRGLRSRRSLPGRYSKHETLVFKFHEWLGKEIYAPADKGPAPNSR